MFSRKTFPFLPHPVLFSVLFAHSPVSFVSQTIVQPSSQCPWYPRCVPVTSTGYGRVVHASVWTPPFWASNTWPGWKDGAVISSRVEVCILVELHYMLLLPRVMFGVIPQLFVPVAAEPRPLRWWGRGDGGGPWEAGGVHRAASAVSPWRALPPGSHAAIAGEHSPETHFTHRLHTPKHAQHCLWTVKIMRMHSICLCFHLPHLS